MLTCKNAEGVHGQKKVGNPWLEFGNSMWMFLRTLCILNSSIHVLVCCSSVVFCCVFYVISFIYLLVQQQRRLWPEESVLSIFLKHSHTIKNTINRVANIWMGANKILGKFWACVCKHACPYIKKNGLGRACFL